MDIRSLLNEKDFSPKQQQPLEHDSKPVEAHLPSPPNSACQPSWAESDTKAARCNLRALLCSEPVRRREDSMSVSPKFERATQPPENMPKSLPCYQCNKLFTRRSDLVRHERIHSGVRPHSCSYRGCGKSFIQRSALTIHERVHTGDKPHECQQCGKPFSDSSSLARHRRTHTGVRPYRCDFPGCGKDFTRKTTLSRHRHQHTTKGHVPASAGRRSMSKPPSTTTLSTVSSYDDLRTPDSASVASPRIQKAGGPGSCYITFQINQPDGSYDHHAKHPAQYQSQISPRAMEPPIYRSSSYPDERPQLPSHRQLSGSALLSPLEMPSEHGRYVDGRRRPVSEDYFSRQRPTLPPASQSYSGSPLPRIVAGWGDEHDSQPQYGPIQSSDYSCRPRERRDSAVSRQYWSIAH